MSTPLRRSVLLPIMLCLLSSGCGQQLGPQDVAPDLGGPDWDQPIDGREIADLDSVDLRFTPVEPSDLGVPVRLLATPKGASPDEEEIIWVFSHDELGKFLLIEQVVDAQPALAEYESLAKQPEGCFTRTPSPEEEEALGEGAGSMIECYAGKHFFTDVDGSRAFVTTGTATTAVHWFEPLPPQEAAGYDAYRSPSLELVIMGPSSSMTPEQAIAAARQV